MKTKLKTVLIALMLLVLIVMLLSCRSCKTTTQSKYLKSDTLQRVEQLQKQEKQEVKAMSSQTKVVELSSEKIPQATAVLTLKTVQLENLPDSASYLAKEKQATLTITKQGDVINVVANCDSLERVCYRYEIEHNDMQLTLTELNSKIMQSEHFRQTLEQAYIKEKKRTSSLFFWNKMLIAVIALGVGWAIYKGVKNYKNLLKI